MLSRNHNQCHHCSRLWYHLYDQYHCFKPGGSKCKRQYQNEPTLSNWPINTIKPKHHHAGTTINQAPNELQCCTCTTNMRTSNGPPSSINAASPCLHTSLQPHQLCHQFYHLFCPSIPSVGIYVSSNNNPNSFQYDASISAADVIHIMRARTVHEICITKL